MQKVVLFLIGTDPRVTILNPGTLQISGSLRGGGGMLVESVRPSYLRVLSCTSVL